MARKKKQKRVKRGHYDVDHLYRVRVAPTSFKTYLVKGSVSAQHARAELHRFLNSVVEPQLRIPDHDIRRLRSWKDLTPDKDTDVIYAGAQYITFYDD